MPIRPENRDKYPSDWREIRKRILQRSDGRCECRGECGLHHDRRCTERHLLPAHYAKGMVVLTIHHRDSDPTNNTDDNLAALCQRCHLRADVKLHSYNRALTRDKRLGQLRFDDGK